jgi:hypothetical protein
MSRQAPSPVPARNGGGDNKGIWIAVIGAFATIIVGYLTYLATIHKADGAQTVTFSGIVTGDDGKGVPNARIMLTEDQNTSQTIPTDQYGNFHVQLSQKTQSLSIRVDSGDEYDVVAIDANPHRTGPEVISVHKKIGRAEKGELVRAVTEFEERLSDVEQIAKKLAPLENASLDERQGPSVEIWRIWYGETYVEKEYQNVKWKTVLVNIRDSGVIEKYEQAYKAITDIEEGDREGKHQTASYLEPRLEVLRNYKETVLEPSIKR